MHGRRGDSSSLNTTAGRQSIEYKGGRRCPGAPERQHTFLTSYMTTVQGVQEVRI